MRLLKLLLEVCKEKVNRKYAEKWREIRRFKKAWQPGRHGSVGLEVNDRKA